MPTKVASAFVEIRPDLSGFRAEARRNINAALAGIRGPTIRIPLVADSSGLTQEVTRAARHAQSAAKINIEAGADTGGVGEHVSAAARTASARNTIELEVDADTSGVNAHVAAAARAASARNEIKLKTDVDTRSASKGLGDFQRSLGAANKSAQFFQTALNVAKIPAFASALQLAAGALNALGAGAVAAVSALAPLAGVAAAGGVGLAALAQGAGTAFLALGGIADAVKELNNVQVRSTGATRDLLRLEDQQVAAMQRHQRAIEALEDAERTGRQQIASAVRSHENAVEALAEAQRDAARANADAARDIEDAEQRISDAREAAAEQVQSALRAVRDAEQGVLEAQRNAAEQVEAATRRVADSRQRVIDVTRDYAERTENALRRVSDSEKRLGDTQRNATRAQQELAAARRAAAEELEDQRLRAQSDALSEEEALLAVTEARQREAQVGARDAQIREAYEEAYQRALEGTEQTTGEALATAEEHQRALLDVRRAELTLAEIRERRADNDAELLELEQQGVEGSDRVRDATDRLADAQDSVVDAQENAADAQRDLVRVQQDASRAIADAQRDLVDSQQNLTRTQEEAARRILESQQRLIDSQRSLTDAQEDGARRVSDAQRDFADAQQRAADIQEDSARRIIEAQRGVSDAATEVGRVQEEVARSITRAQRDLQEEISNTARDMAIASSSMAASADIATDAFDGLAPSAQRFALFLFSLKPAIDALKETAANNLLPGLEVAIRTSLELLPLMHHALATTGLLLGDLAVMGANLITSGPWTRDFGILIDANVRIMRNLGMAGLEVADSLRNIVISAIPLAEWISALILRLSILASEFFETSRQTGALARFFEQTRQVIEVVLSIMGNLGSILVSIGRAAYGLGRDLLTAADQATEGWARFFRSTEGQNQLKKYFDDVRPVLNEVFLLIGAISGALLKFAVQPETANLIRQLREELLPALVALGETAGATFTESLIGLMTSVARLFAALGGEAGPLTLFVDQLARMLDVLTWLIENVPGFGEFIGVMALLSATMRGFQFISFLTGFGSIIRLGPLVGGAFSTIGTAIGGFVSSVGLVPIAIGLAIAAVGLLAFWVVTHWDEVKAATARMAEVVSGWWRNITDTVSRNVSEMATNNARRLVTFGIEIGSTWDRISRNTSDWWRNIKDTVTTFMINLVTDGVIQLFSFDNQISGIWDRIRTTASNWWQNIKDTILGSTSGTVTAAIADFLVFHTWWPELWRSVWDTAQRFWRSIRDTVVDFAYNLVTSAITNLGQLIPRLAGIWGDLRSNAADWWRNIRDTVINWVQNIPDTVSNVLSNLGTIFYNAAIGGINRFIEGLRAGAGAVAGWVRFVFGGQGDGWGVDAQTGAAGRVPAGAIGAASGGGATAHILMDYFRRSGVPGRASSVVRPGATTATGNQSYHAVGRAVDFVGPNLMAIFNAFLPMMSQLRELIYSGANFSIKNGQAVARYAVNDHWDHVHVALEKGGIVNKPTVALIGESGPEAVIPLSGRNAPGGVTLANTYHIDARGSEVGVERRIREVLDDHDRELVLMLTQRGVG